MDRPTEERSRTIILPEVIHDSEVQESLADAMVSDSSACIKAPSNEIYSK